MSTLSPNYFTVSIFDKVSRIMSDFEKELEAMSQEMGDEPEVALPSIEEQKAVVAKLKQLEAEGKLTPEVLEQYFGQFNAKKTPIH